MLFNSKSLIDFNQFTKNYLFIFISLIVIIQFNLTYALYEDQIGKFDWRQRFIGQIKYAHFDPQTSDRIIVATNKNVLAALNTKTGDILWRKTFEKNEPGTIRLLHVVENRIPSSRSEDNVAITVSESTSILVRGWTPITGNLLWEWSVPLGNGSERGTQTDWFYQNHQIVQVQTVYGSHIQAQSYFDSTGQTTTTEILRGKIPGSHIQSNKCILAAPFYACVNDKTLTVIGLTADVPSHQIKTLRVAGTKIRALAGSAGTHIIVVDNEIIDLLNLDAPTMVASVQIPANGFLVQKQNDQNLLLTTTTTTTSTTNRMLQIESIDLENGNKANIHIPYDESFGEPTIIDVRCKNDQLLSSCRILLSTDDEAIILIQQSKLKWIREEALASIVAMEMIDLPLSDSEGAIETELKSKGGNIIEAMIRRISNQIIHFRNVILSVLGLGAPPSASQKADLVRDAFGLHKMIVVATASGKIFGIDNISGKHHWIKYIPNFGSFTTEQSIKIVVQRTSRHFPYSAQCAVIGRNTITGNGIIYQFNPISGQSINGGLLNLNYQIQQIMLLHLTDANFCRGIVLFDKQNEVHVVPESTSKLAHGIYVYTANKSTGIVSGYYVEYANEKLSATIIWQISLGGPGNAHKITNLASKNPIEHVHSQGRVLNDRSVLYKYINPNLVAIATQGPDAIHKFILNVHLVDVVSGSIVATMTHRRVRDPVHMVHSENWLVYSYYNEKLRRTEITTMELYEGKTQTNSTVWSSLDAPPIPMIERQSYIIPANVVSLKETITEKGITNKHVLIALSSGAVVEMPWAFLDPRRPSLNYNQAREEGVIPYIPELQIPSENIINYNQTIANLHGIYTAPSGLESTCLIVAYGLDLFVTRLAPSKTFDLLKEDFDYILISAVLAGLTIASVVVKHLSSRKAVKQAWK